MLNYVFNNRKIGLISLPVLFLKTKSFDHYRVLYTHTHTPGKYRGETVLLVADENKYKRQSFRSGFSTTTSTTHSRENIIIITMMMTITEWRKGLGAPVRDAS